MFGKKKAEEAAAPPVNELLMDDEELYALRGEAAKWIEEHHAKYEAHLRDLIIRRLATLDGKLLVTVMRRSGNWEFKIGVSELASEVLLKRL